jgi:hypothetical protein
MNNKTTIIYYSSNREKEDFERRVRDNILKNSGGLPIISVTHKPIDFGKNICVRNVGVSGFNMFRQVQIALQEVKTEFAISAEADCLYPPDYFTFIPERNDVCYRNKNLYVLRFRYDCFGKKEAGATHAQIVGTQYYLNRLNELFLDAPQWSPEEKNFPKERRGKEDIFDEITYYETENPVVQIKTDRSMRWHTACDRTRVYEIPYWGTVKQLRTDYPTKKI